MQLEVTPPEPLGFRSPNSRPRRDDWEAKAHNKEIEVIEVINIINPVAAYITEGFKQYGDRFSPTLHEEWADTQVQLTAPTLYEDCKERREAGDFDKKLFLDLEEVWQLLVKTGVAGVRAKSMVDSELAHDRLEPQARSLVLFLLLLVALRLRPGPCGAAPGRAGESIGPSPRGAVRATRSGSSRESTARTS